MQLGYLAKSVMPLQKSSSKVFKIAREIDEIEKKYLGKPYNMRTAVTSHRRTSLYGPVIKSMSLFPGPIIGLFNT